MKPNWNIEDFIDLEYFLQVDGLEGKEPAGADPVEQDRGIYLNHIAPRVTNEGELPRKTLIRLWLDGRRQKEKERSGQETILPGDAFRGVFRFLSVAMLAVGGAIGAGLAFSLLGYTGKEPSNVAVYMGALVLTQALATIFFASLPPVRLALRRGFRPSLVHTLMGRVLSSGIKRIKKQTFTHLTGEQRNSLLSTFGLVRGKGRIYGSLFYWPVFIRTQVFGIGFNLGVLAATLVKVIGSDIAFGWQSTLRIGPRAVLTIVEHLAIPWSWFLPPEIAHPSLTQIEGSRIILKDGITHLANQDLSAWWPFLCLAVLFYGLLPRGILLAFGVIFQARALRKPDLTHVGCDRLMERMLNPSIRTRGRSGAEADEIDPCENPMEKIPPRAPHEDDARSTKRAIVLVPEDIAEPCRDPELASAVFTTLGYRVERKMIFDKDYDADQQTLETLARMDRTSGPWHVLVLQEAWQPPIEETLSFLKNLRRAVGEGVGIVIALIGLPGRGAIFTRVSDADFNLWQKQTRALGDPYLRLERMVAGAAS